MFVKLRDPLSFPAGEKPGVDYGHPACANGPLLLSAVPAAVGSKIALDLSTGSLSTGGLNTSFLMGALGPSIKQFGSAPDQWTGRDTTAYTAYTTAFIAQP